MSVLAIQTSLPLPQPKQAITITPATLADVAWIDSLQKRHRNGVGWQALGAIEGKIRAGAIIVAWATSPCSLDENQDTGKLPVPLGYCMASDRYMKHENVGIIYQMNVEPTAQRGFVGAALLKAQFERSAYGCRLYCCWCAQDLEANRFWEAMGFVPLAYRAGSEKKSRTHIFWQKRIRENDQETPWWFPSETKGGSMADRLVFPIPAGTHWSDAKPVILPGTNVEERSKELPSPRAKKPEVKVLPKRVPLSGALCFAPPVVASVTESVEKPKREKKPKAKNDPKLVAAARELRDRWLEHVNAGGAGEMLLEGAGKYEVSRALPQNVVESPRLLTAA